MREELINRIRMHEGIDDSLIEYCTAPGERYIYGNGAQAATCLGFFREMEVPVDGLLLLPGYAMPELKGFWGRMLRSAKTVSITDLNAKRSSETVVLIASPRESYTAAKEFLERWGFQNIYTCAWERNQYLRDVCFDISALQDKPKI